MKITLNKPITYDARYLQVNAGVRYWEDATVDGVEDVDGKLIPCRLSDCWCPRVDLKHGRIINWHEGKIADIHYKVCDDGSYDLLDDDEKIIIEKSGYVPDMLAIDDSGYGDYIIMTIDEKGFIKNFESDLEYFKEEED